MNHQEILEKWPLMGALWLMEDPCFFKNNELQCEKAAKKATSKDIELLADFAKASVYDVRLKVAENPNTPVEVLEALAGDGYVVVRMCVAENPSTPVEVLERLANDRDEMVCIEAKNTLKTITQQGK